MRKNDVLLILAILVIGILILNKFSAKKEDISELEINKKSEDLIHTTSSDEDHYEQRQHDTNDILVSRTNAITLAVEKVQPAVVSVNVIKTQVVRRYTNPFDNPFFGFFDNFPMKREIKSIGSGVIFTNDGYIITNSHVVEGATKIKIILSDARQYDGDLIGIDSVHDVAILKIEGDDIPCAKLGDSSDIIIGEWAVAVGNPYGFLIKDSKPSVSVGVISAVDRNFAENREQKVYRRMIQTDAAINPGNSGGPLVNIYGEVIGINTFIFSETGGNIGIGFAIPIDKVKKVSQELIKYGKVRDIWFGFKVQDINPMIASYLKLDSADGVIVAYIENNGPADKAGLQKSDIIRKINKMEINTANDAELVITDVAVGDVIELEVYRKNKKKLIRFNAVEH
ncbi:MAG: trypsin-like peptidase domain-containing protein [Candidatus Cloacimonetes bacterium]|nr:trypsin-like peptidase domain-containing protein [Candidatus Cloacimonadota bacterium]